jgi:hypothetical protein
MVASKSSLISTFLIITQIFLLVTNKKGGQLAAFFILQYLLYSVH